MCNSINLIIIIKYSQHADYKQIKNIVHYRVDINLKAKLIFNVV